MVMKTALHGISGVTSSLAKLSPRYWAAPALNDAMRQYRKDLGYVIKDTYATRHNLTYINRLMITKRATKNRLRTELHVRYVPHKLSMFIVRQTAVTTGNLRKRVVSTKRGSGFKQSITQQKRTSTLVTVIKGKPLKLVHGTMKHKGFLQDKNGNILERSQKATWSKGVRLPVHALFGLSISQMSVSHRVAVKMKEGKYLTMIEGKIYLG